MSICSKYKIASLLRRNQKFHCLSYDWFSHGITVHKSEQQYLEDIAFHKENGMIKRAECYSDEVFVVGEKSYLIYLVSYGDFRKGKMVRGENPIAKGLGICLFDYVYVFVEPLNEAKKNIQSLIQKMENKGNFFQRNLVLQTFKNVFGQNYEDSMDHSFKIENNTQEMY